MLNGVANDGLDEAEARRNAWAVSLSHLATGGAGIQAVASPFAPDRERRTSLLVTSGRVSILGGGRNLPGREKLCPYLNMASSSEQVPRAAEEGPF